MDKRSAFAIFPKIFHLNAPYHRLNPPWLFSENNLVKGVLSTYGEQLSHRILYPTIHFPTTDFTVFIRIYLNIT